MSYIIIVIVLAIFAICFVVVYSFSVQKKMKRIQYDLHDKLKIHNSQNGYTLDVLQGDIGTSAIASSKELEKQHESNMYQISNRLDNNVMQNTILKQLPKHNIHSKERPKSVLRDMTGDMMKAEAQIIKIQNKIESLPLYAQADAIDKMNKTIDHVKTENAIETRELQDINQVILRNQSHTHDVKVTHDSLLSHYSTKSKLDAYSAYLDGTLAKFENLHNDVLTKNKFAKYANLKEMSDLKDLVSKNESDLEKTYSLKTKLKNLVDAKSIQSDIVTMNAMNGYALRTDISSVSYTNYKKTMAELDAKINKMNQTVRSLPNEYSTVNETKDIMKLIQTIQKESIKAQEKINIVMAKYVKNTAFDQGLAALDGKEKVSKKTIQSLQVQLDGLKEKLSKFPESYIKQADAVVKYSLQKDTNTLIRKMNLFPDLSALNSMQVQYTPLFAKADSIKDLQLQVDKFGNIDATFASLSDFRDLADFIDKKTKDKAAYELAHAHDLYTQKGEVSYTLRGGDPKAVVAADAGGWQNGWKYLVSDFDNWPANVPMSYYGWSWYKVLYPKPFSDPATKITAKCVSYPSAKITINRIDHVGTSGPKSTKGFLIYAEVDLSDADLYKTQTFAWSATGPR